MKLSEDFLEYVDNRLPAAYEDDPAAYDGFIASFGTHYFETGHFGGFLYQKTAIESEYLSSTDEQEISVNLEASFKSKLGIKGGFEKGKEDVRESLKAKSRSTFYYYGGRTDLSDTAGGDKDDEDSSNKNRVDFLKEWQPTLLKDPWLLSGKLKPIELLVRNGTIRPQVAKAVAVRRARAHLDDLKRSVRLGGVRLSADDRKELETIERLLKSPKAVSTEQLLRYGGEGVEALLERVQKIRGKPIFYVNFLVTFFSSFSQPNSSLARFTRRRPTFATCVTASWARRPTVITPSSSPLPASTANR